MDVNTGSTTGYDQESYPGWLTEVPDSGANVQPGQWGEAEKGIPTDWSAGGVTGGVGYFTPTIYGGVHDWENHDMTGRVLAIPLYHLDVTGPVAGGSDYPAMLGQAVGSACDPMASEQQYPEIAAAI